MKQIFLILFALFVVNLTAQSYIGFLTDNYSGIHSVINNPANIVDSRFKTDINLIGISSFFANDYYGFNLNDVFSDDYDIQDNTNISPESKNNFLSNIDVLGPAFMFNIDTQNAIALYTRARVFSNLSGINGEALEGIIDNIDDNIDFQVNQGDAYASFNVWSEIGASYARVLLNKNEHFLKGGLTLKYLQGLGNGYGVGSNLNIDFDANAIAINNGSVTTSGEVSYGYSENIEELDDLGENLDLNAGNGFGLDIGVVYEWRPDYKNYIADKNALYKFKDLNKYKLKFALSVTDLGSISYDGNEERYDFNNTLTQEDFEDIEIDELETFYTLLSPGSSQRAILPTALHANIDWSINKRLFLNLNTDVSLTSKNKANTSRIANVVSLTPRFESKWFSFYSPVSIAQYSGMHWGAGFRLGPLYMGSGSVLTVLLNDDIKGADVYLGLKIPVYQSKPKDKDGDGVFDKEDTCPKIPGPKENNGCPWPDTDNDGVLDKDDLCPEIAGEKELFGCLDSDNDGTPNNDDKCPEISGPKENSGCPWPDTDNDGVIDINDACPKEAGLKELSGCPDFDSDGIADINDKCPKVFGVKENDGCPNTEVPAIMITKEVQETLNAYAKTILFEAGKSAIKLDSKSILDDIVAVLNKYPDTKFTIEGHTDSIGNAVLNKTLSTSRANAVKTYLVSHGVEENRLSTYGYGESKPIDTNGTKLGRSNNRRVEINLSN